MVFCLQSLCKRALVFCVLVYQKYLSPLKRPWCRFYPCCSGYVLQCLENDPLPTALRKSILRLLKCHPFHPGGVDLP